MEQQYVTREEHEEFRRRLEDMNKRQDKRIELLEESLNETRALSANVDRLATNMENMLKEQEKQGKRLETLEGRDGEKWRKVMGYIATAIISVIVGVVAAQIGLS